VNSALSVSISPASATLDVSQSKTFTSTVSGGTLPYSYQWYQNGTAIGGADTSTYLFTPTLRGHYKFYLIVTDSASPTANAKTSATATVTVNNALSVTVSPTTVTLDVGQSKTFTSSVIGGTSPYTYQWYKNGTAVSGAKSSTYAFTPSSPGNYNFSVVVKDSVGVQATSATVSATVNSALSVSISPASATLDVGQPQAFTATVSGGTLSYSYQWYLNGAAVSGATGASWTFTPSSTGSYTIYVKVTDGAGQQAKSNTATVTVKAAAGAGMQARSNTATVTVKSESQDAAVANAASSSAVFQARS
jgi:uncharacterized protein YjdB